MMDNADTNFTFEVGLRQRTERNTVNIDLSHETIPNSNGFLTLRDELHVYLIRSFHAAPTGSSRRPRLRHENARRRHRRRRSRLPASGSRAWSGP